MRQRVLAATIAVCVAVTGARAQPPARKQTATASVHAGSQITEEVAFDNGDVRLRQAVRPPLPRPNRTQIGSEIAMHATPTGKPRGSHLITQGGLACPRRAKNQDRRPPLCCHHHRY